MKYEVYRPDVDGIIKKVTADNPKKAISKALNINENDVEFVRANSSNCNVYVKSIGGARVSTTYYFLKSKVIKGNQNVRNVQNTRANQNRRNTQNSRNTQSSRSRGGSLKPISYNQNSKKTSNSFLSNMTKKQTPKSKEKARQNKLIEKYEREALKELNKYQQRINYMLYIANEIIKADRNSANFFIPFLIKNENNWFPNGFIKNSSISYKMKEPRYNQSKNTLTYGFVYDDNSFSAIGFYCLYGFNRKKEFKASFDLMIDNQGQCYSESNLKTSLIEVNYKKNNLKIREDLVFLKEDFVKGFHTFEKKFFREVYNKYNVNADRRNI